MKTDVLVGNMPDDGVILDLNLDTHIPTINIDVLPTDGCAAPEEIIPNFGLTIWSENQALIGANEELCALVQEMRRREFTDERLCDDPQDVMLARENKIFAYMNKINHLRYKRRRMLFEIFALKEEVSHLRCGSRHVDVAR
uniref:Uncharacterized protein n=1 Tax=Tanacetum cinerariifolium TaxID=118510 RepID=A0A6L2MMZ8_TANCI|nr:hypothetical protein [Tanacetum cinerariifolium]